jgi:peptidoglycan-associated lipoprotein
MSKRSLVVIVLILCFGLIVSGCPKKTVIKEEPTVKKAEESAAEREKAAKLEAEQREREARERETKEELAKLKEQEAGKQQQEQKEFEKSLVAKKTPGIEGEVFETKMLKRIHFDFDKYDIRLEDTESLKQNAAVLKRFPSVKIQIEGHCDERGTGEYNLALGERRAHSAKEYLVSLGVDGNRISTISYGKEKPLDPGHNEEAWAKNRRDEFVVLSK